MKIGDILDMRDYLANRCYCPNEIYGLDGIFFQLFDADEECEILSEGERDIFIIATPREGKEQIIYIEHDGNTVSDCTRFDATENNKKQVREYLKGERDQIFLDEYENTVKPLDEIMRMSDAVLID